MTLDQLNAAETNAAKTALLACCGSTQWAEGMANARPFRDTEQLHDRAEERWRAVGQNDWLEAFAKHPKIGAQTANGWSAREQRGMRNASERATEAMRRLNEEYESKFGYIFIVCATGKEADEMLGLLQERIMNDPGAELRIAAAEQAKIMHLRLDKLIQE